MKHLLRIGLFLVWMAAILAAFFVVQRPDFLQIPQGLWHLLHTLLWPIAMAFLATAISRRWLSWLDPIETWTLGTALGLLIFGLSGFALAILGWANQTILLTALIIATLSLALSGDLRATARQALTAWHHLRSSAQRDHHPTPLFTGLALGLAFLLGLAPPAEDFDGLFYHLTVPALWLRNGLHDDLVPLPHFWYPHLVEGLYLWPMVFGNDTAPHLIHFLWLLLTLLLLWHWGRQIGGDLLAWKAIALLLTMPSLPWLAAWAYTDYALVFSALAALYALWKWRLGEGQRWLSLAGALAGLAISVKYTAFIVPVTLLILTAIWGRKVPLLLRLGLATALVAGPWYLRNWIGTGNPVYPFVFGGRGWDDFLGRVYASPGSGLGLDLIQILALPLTATLGIRDANYFDGRIGPFFLILLPWAMSTFGTVRQATPPRQIAWQLIGLLALLGGSFWTLGVIASAHLFQTRLLFPVLIPLSLVYAAGMERLSVLDRPQIKIGFIVRTLLTLTIGVNLLNFGLQVTARHPLAVALGMVSRQEYLARWQPVYAQALALVQRTPPEARILLLFEPRSYGMARWVQPDSINAHLAHALWQHGSTETMIAAWREQRFTHVLISNAGAEFLLSNAPADLRNAFQALTHSLEEVASAPDVTLYRLP